MKQTRYFYRICDITLNTKTYIDIHALKTLSFHATIMTPCSKQNILKIFMVQHFI